MSTVSGLVSGYTAAIASLLLNGPKTMSRIFSFCLITFLLCACSKKVITDPKQAQSGSQISQAQAISSIELSLAEPVMAKVKDEDVDYSQRQFQNYIQQYLAKFDLYDPSNSTGVSADVTITNLRVRSYLASAALSYGSGPDFMRGNVTVKDGQGNLLSQFEVDVVYGKSGLFSGGQEKRLLWLKRAFSQQIALQLSGNND